MTAKEQVLCFIVEVVSHSKAVKNDAFRALRDEKEAKRLLDRAGFESSVGYFEYHTVAESKWSATQRAKANSLFQAEAAEATPPDPPGSLYAVYRLAPSLPSSSSVATAMPELMGMFKVPEEADQYIHSRINDKIVVSDSIRLQPRYRRVTRPEAKLGEAERAMAIERGHLSAPPAPKHAAPPAPPRTKKKHKKAEIEVLPDDYEEEEKKPSKKPKIQSKLVSKRQMLTDPQFFEYYLSVHPDGSQTALEAFEYSQLKRLWDNFDADRRSSRDDPFKTILDATASAADDGLEF